MSAAERENSLIENAIEVFASCNYRIATVAKIASESGITEPIIYRHFNSKKSLFLAALERIDMDMLKGWQEATSSSENPKEALRGISAFHYNFVINQKARAKLLFQAISEVDDLETKNNLSNHFQSCVDLLKDLIRQCKEKGLMREDIDEDMAAWLLISLGIGTGFMNLFGFEQELERRHPINAFDFLLNSFS
jgi:AcrR family transcriptional regulator